jgi:endonuclease/exonuclease/phosphatase (EEP) superfamily protein YafD
MRFLRVALLTVFATGLFLAAALCAGAAVAAHFGRTSLSWDILAHFAPLWFAGSTGALLAALMLRGYGRTLIVAMGAVGALAAGALIAPELLRSTGPRAPAGAVDALKIVQFNLWHSNTELDGLAEWLMRESPDVVVFEEFRPEVRQTIEAKTPWRLAVSNSDVAIFSRMSPVRTGPPRLSGKSPGPLATATFRDRRGEFTVIGVHNAWPTDIADQQRQERRLLRVLALSPRERTIVAGDLNSTPWSFSRRQWDRTFGVIRRDRAVFSWPAMQYKRLRWLGVFPFLPIDHVYAGAGWATVKVARGPKLGSDHYPLIVTLAPVAPR